MKRSMCEYRVPVDINIQCDQITPLKDQDIIDLLPDFVIKMLHVDLFDKYGDYITNKNEDVQSVNDNNHNHSSSSINDNSNENFNQYYYFWRDDSTNKKKHDSSGGGSTVSASTTTTAAVAAPPLNNKEFEEKSFTHEILYYTLNYDIIYSNDKLYNETNTIGLSALNYSTLTGKSFEGTQYVTLISHKLEGKKKDTAVLMSNNPFFSVIAHNNQAYVNNDKNNRKNRIPLNHNTYTFPVIYDKDTASAAPHWIADLVVGPFKTRKEGVEFSFELVTKTRGIRSKREKTLKLAKKYNKPVYSSQKNINKPIEEYLIENNAPHSFLNVCNEIHNEFTSYLCK